MIDLSNISNIMDINSPASNGVLQEVEHAMDVVLPYVYILLLHYSNGFAIDEGLVIYGTDELVERNKTLEVNEYATGFVAIGDDGGDNVFLMAQRFDQTNVIMVDVGDMNPDNAIEITRDFIQWVNAGLLFETGHKVNDHLEVCDIQLVNVPSGGLRDLLKIKNVLGINITAKELLDRSRNIPCVLVEGFPYGKAEKLITSLDTLGDSLYIKLV